MTQRTFALIAALTSTAALAQDAASEPQAAQPAAAEQQTAAEEPSTDGPMFELSLKGGGHFPQVANPMSTSFDGLLKFGVAPLEGRRLQFFADVGYSQPKHELQASDARLSEAGADYRSQVLVKDLAATVGVSYFILPPSSYVVPYAGAGFRAHFLRMEVQGGTDNPFGNYVETDTRYGGVAFGGAGLHLGPGLLLGELAFGYAPVDERVTGVSNIGALSVLLGYGLLF